MDEDRKEITRRILDFTLEIIYLLTGEDYTIVKKTSGDSVTPIIHLQESGGWSRSHFPITDPPPHSPIHDQKILELTHKMMELLTGEVPIRCQDVAVYFSMKEWEYIEGHRDLYEDNMMEDHQDLYENVMMENHRPVTSIDGSSRRCPCPLSSQDWGPEEDPNIQENHQVDDAELYTRPIKVEVEEEQMMVNHRFMKGVKEEIPADVTAENPSKNSEESVLLSLSYKVQDEDIPQHSSRQNLITLNVHPGIHSTDLSYNPPNHEEPSDQTQVIAKSAGQEGGKRFQCGECGKRFTKNSTLCTHRRIHTGVKPYSCSECGKCFRRKSHLDRHERIHTGEKPYSCSECGKCFIEKSTLLIHERIHTGEKPFTCSDCGIFFRHRSSLVAHLKSHTGDKSFSCSECGKCCIIHGTEKPCSLCGKRFADKSGYIKPERIHTGDELYSCSECGKGKSDLVNLGEFNLERSHLRVQNVGTHNFAYEHCYE